MSFDTSWSETALREQREALRAAFAEKKALGLNLNMARGKPSREQLDLSMEMLDILHGESDMMLCDGEDSRNYGIPEGIPEARALFGELMDAPPSDVVVSGNSSLTLMFDLIASAMMDGIGEEKPWSQQGGLKFLCPVPGYDRHFAITEYFHIEMIPIPMTATGPDMDEVERLVSSDPQVKGIWCVPKYSNPQGITYSDETVRRMAALRPAAPDFRIFWDNAYCVHELTEQPEQLLSIFAACREAGNEDLAIQFTSTSKITFAGAGVAALAGSETTLKNFRRRLQFKTIGPDKINQLRHVRFLRDMDGIYAHMEKHRQILAPRFAVVLELLERELKEPGVASWVTPKGGYFVSVDVMEGCAARVVELCKEAGVTLTGAGATYPKGCDPKDSNIRLAPSFPPVEELRQAMEVFCISAKLAAVEKLLGEQQ